VSGGLPPSLQPDEFSVPPLCCRDQSYVVSQQSAGDPAHSARALQSPALFQTFPSWTGKAEPDESSGGSSGGRASVLGTGRGAVSLDPRWVSLQLPYSFPARRGREIEKIGMKCRAFLSECPSQKRAGSKVFPVDSLLYREIWRRVRSRLLPQPLCRGLPGFVAWSHHSSRMQPYLAGFCDGWPFALVHRDGEVTRIR